MIGAMLARSGRHGISSGGDARESITPIVIREGLREFAFVGADERDQNPRQRAAGSRLGDASRDGRCSRGRNGVEQQRGDDGAHDRILADLPGNDICCRCARD
jgi:hypothetical protein